MPTPNHRPLLDTGRRLSHRDVDEILRRQRRELRRNCLPDYRLLLIAIGLAVTGVWLLWCFYSDDALILGRMLFSR